MLCSLMQSCSGHQEGGSRSKIETRTLWGTGCMQDLDGDIWKDRSTKETQWSWTVDTGGVEPSCTESNVTILSVQGFSVRL